MIFKNLDVALLRRRAHSYRSWGDGKRSNMINSKVGVWSIREWLGEWVEVLCCHWTDVIIKQEAADHGWHTRLTDLRIELHLLS